MPESLNSLGARDRLEVGDRSYTVYRLHHAMEALGADLDRLPFTHRILLENLLRYEDGVSVDRSQIEAVAHWDPGEEPDTEIAFRPGRVVLALPRGRTVSQVALDAKPVRFQAQTTGQERYVVVETPWGPHRLEATLATR